MNITVEFSGRQTGATTKALGTFMVDPTNSFFMGTWGTSSFIRSKIPIEFASRISKPFDDRVQFLYGLLNKESTVIFDEWQFFDTSVKVQVMDIVKRAGVRAVYQFGSPKKLFSRKDFDRICEIKKCLAAKGMCADMTAGYLCSSEDWEDLMLDWSTEPGAVVKTCGYELIGNSVHVLNACMDADDVRKNLDGAFLKD